MLSLASLKNLQTQSQGTVAGMQSTLDRLNGEIERIKSDTTRNPGYIAQLIDDARKKAIEGIGEKLGFLAANAKVAASQQQYWASKLFLLSRTRFDQDAAKDAVIRAAKIDELAAMPLPLLSVVTQNALEENDLPLIWLCHLANAKAGHPEAKSNLSAPIPLDTVKIPDQDEALTAVRICQQLVASAELIAGAVSGTGMAPLKKLQLARQAMA